MDDSRHAQRVHERRSVLTAMTRVLDDPVSFVALVAGAQDSTEAIALVREAYGVSATDALAMVDMQFRRCTGEDSQRIREELAQLAVHPAPPGESVAHDDGSTYGWTEELPG